MNHNTTPGPVWADRARNAYRRAEVCRAVAAVIDEETPAPGDPWAAELIRRRVSLMQAESLAWESYGDLCGTAAGNALLADLERTWPIPGQAERRARYDTPGDAK